MEPKMRVLIADTDSNFRLLLREVMRTQSDMEIVAETADGVETLELIQKFRPDVVLMELALTRQDGMEVLRKIPETGCTPCTIVLSAFVTANIVSECSALGATCFIPKPCDIDSILNYIRLVMQPKGFAGIVPLTKPINFIRKLLQTLSVNWFIQSTESVFFFQQRPHCTSRYFMLY